MEARKSGNWDGKIRFLRNNGVLPRGLLQNCLDCLEEHNIKYEMDDRLNEEDLDISDFEDVIRKELIANQGEKKLEPWANQWSTAKKLLKSVRGVSRSATSSGKSFSITMISKYLLHKKIVKRVLLVVPRTDLVVQFYKDMEEYGVDRKDIGMYFGEVKEVGKPITIATWQSAQNIKDKKFFHDFECLIVDECHNSNSGDKSSNKKRKTSGTQVRQICDHCINAKWRFGLTGTLPKDELEMMTLVGGIGPKVDEVMAKELMKEGRVTNVKITATFIDYDKKVVRDKIKQYLLDDGFSEDTKLGDISPTAKFNAEKKFLENYIPRLRVISKITKSRMEHDENVLILANTINFGENIVKTLKFLLKGEYNEIYYISGSMKTDKRKEIREKMENGTKIIVVATTSLFSTGISVKNLHNIIFGNIGKSEIIVLQAIGRTLRLHASKSLARVYDLCDNLPYSKKHAKERLDYYANEEFDMSMLEVTI